MFEQTTDYVTRASRDLKHRGRDLGERGREFARRGRDRALRLRRREPEPRDATSAAPLIAGIALAALVAGAAYYFGPDLKRYLKIRRM